MQNAYASFEQFLVVKSGLQPVTIHGYMGSVRRAREVIGDNPSHEDIIKYIHVMYSSTFSYSYKTNTALALEKWLEFLGRPIKLGRQKKPRPIVKDTLNEAEITKLMFNTKNIREEAILSLLAYSAIRNLELCSVKVKDLNLGANQLTIIRGKGLKDRVVYIPPVCSNVILNYLRDYPRGSDEFLFTTLRHKNKYHTQDLRKLIHVLARRAGILKRVYPHLLRHSLAMNMLNRGANVFVIKEQLGHAILETTLHYLNSLGYAGKNNYDKYAPSYN